MENKIKTLDISGIGGGYEATCQKMLTAGLKFLAENIGFNWAQSYKQFENIFVLLVPRVKTRNGLTKHCWLPLIMIVPGRCISVLSIILLISASILTIKLGQARPIGTNLRDS